MLAHAAGDAALPRLHVSAPLLDIGLTRLVQPSEVLAHRFLMSLARPLRLMCLQARGDAPSARLQHARAEVSTSCAHGPVPDLPPGAGPRPGGCAPTASGAINTAMAATNSPNRFSVFISFSLTIETGLAAATNIAVRSVPSFVRCHTGRVPSQAVSGLPLPFPCPARRPMCAAASARCTHGFGSPRFPVSHAGPGESSARRSRSPPCCAIVLCSIRFGAPCA